MSKQIGSKLDILDARCINHFGLLGFISARRTWLAHLFRQNSLGWVDYGLKMEGMSKEDTKEMKRKQAEEAEARRVEAELRKARLAEKDSHESLCNGMAPFISSLVIDTHCLLADFYNAGFARLVKFRENS